MLTYGIWSNYFIDTPIETVIDRFVEHGFTNSEFSDEHGTMALSSGKDPFTIGQTIRSYGQTKGFAFPQGHLKLDLDIVLLSDDTIMDTIIPWLDLFHGIGIRKAVLHPGGLYQMHHDDLLNKRVSILTKIIHYIQDHDYDLTICIENLYEDSDSGPLPMMATSKEMMELIHTVALPHLGVCLDTGHLNMVTGDTQSQFILGCGPYLQALHIADNQGHEDQHMMPYGKGTVNWDEVLHALHQIHYHDMFNLEIPGESHAPVDILGYKLDYLKKLCDSMVQTIKA